MYVRFPFVIDRDWCKYDNNKARQVVKQRFSVVGQRDNGLFWDSGQWMTSGLAQLQTVWEWVCGRPLINEWRDCNLVHSLMTEKANSITVCPFICLSVCARLPRLTGSRESRLSAENYRQWDLPLQADSAVCRWWSKQTESNGSKLYTWCDSCYTQKEPIVTSSHCVYQ